jgi:catechol 2,3-dioxygenase-like lactoylglutathione lyase family enzyme
MYLSYFGIRVTNLERSVSFYTKFFKLKEVAHVDNTRRGAGLVVLLRDQESGAKLELNYYPNDSQFASPYSTGEGLDHLCFRVEDLWGILETLERNGIHPIELPKDVADMKTIAYIRDPDGIWIELWQDNRKGNEPIPEGY